MGTLDAAADALVEILGDYQPAIRFWSGQMGDGNGTVLVPGRSGYCFVRMPDGVSVPAYNTRVPPENDLPVWVGFDPLNETLFQVLSVRNTYGAPNPQNTIGNHAEKHTWPGGNDVVWIDARQFLPLRVMPATGMVVQCYRSIAWAEGGWLAVTSTVDLVGLVPTTGAVYVLVYLDDAGVLQARAGLNSGMPTFLTPAFIPLPATGERALAGVRLLAGQTDLIDDATRSDFVDLRFTAGPTGGGAKEADMVMRIWFGA